MPDSTLAGIITACASLFIAIGGVITALGVLLPLLRSSREVHSLVNSASTDAKRYQAALVKALLKHGIEVPDDQSLPDVPALITIQRAPRRIFRRRP